MNWLRERIVKFSREKSTGPLILEVEPNANPQEIVESLHLPHYDSALFFMGGAASTDEETQQTIEYLFQHTLTTVSQQRKIVVGDGGTRSGIMKALGEARKRSSHPFPLIGVSPKISVRYGQHNQNEPKAHDLEPNHSHIICVENKDPQVTTATGFGTETSMMYTIFNELAKNAPSLGIAAGGGSVTLQEILANIEAKRNIILLQGTGRLTDALANHLLERPPANEEQEIMLKRFLSEVKKRHLDTYRALLHVFPVNDGPATLSRWILTELGHLSNLR